MWYKTASDSLIGRIEKGEKGNDFQFERKVTVKKLVCWSRSARTGLGCFAHICAKVTGRRAATLALLLAGLGALTGVAATGKSAAFPVDLREGDRVSAGTEVLTFSNLWDGDGEATVTSHRTARRFSREAIAKLSSCPVGALADGC